MHLVTIVLQQRGTPDATVYHTWDGQDPPHDLFAEFASRISKNEASDFADAIIEALLECGGAYPDTTSMDAAELKSAEFLQRCGVVLTRFSFDVTEV